MSSAGEPSSASGAAVLRLEPFEGHAGLRDSLAFWRQALARTALDPLCNAPEWVLAHAEAWAPTEDVFGWRVRDAAGRPAAFLAFRREPPRGRFALRRAQLVCDGSFDSDYIDLVIRPGLERAVLERALDALAVTEGVDAVHVSAVPADSPTLAALRTLLRERGLPSRAGVVECASAVLPGSFEDYLKALKKRMRSKVRQAVRVAGESGVSFAWCDAAESLDEHLEGLFRLHTQRWEAVGEPGAFAREERRRFYRAFAHDALAAGLLRFSRLEAEGRVVAYQFGARAGERYYQMQEGFDTSYGEARVATALRALSVEHLIAEGVRHYDFMAGTSRHKADWGGEPRDCASLAFALPNVRARLSYGARAFVDRWRDRRASSA